MSEIIENDIRVIRLDTRPPSYWWENKEPPNPKYFTCNIESLSLEGNIALSLSIETLWAILEKAEIEYEKIEDEWLNPTTDCCNIKRPREETNQQFISDTLHITCKPGYSCKREAKVA